MGSYRLEACVQVAYDTLLKKWEVIVPEQRVTGVSVDYDPNEAITMTALNENLLLVADIHSHHVMPAFFSHTDDEDEVGVRLFGVFGNMKGTTYDLLFRAGAGGHFVRMPAEDLLEGFDRWDGSAERLCPPGAPAEWLEKVSPPFHTVV